MNCMNCGAFLADKDLDYCPNCGCNVLIQKKVDYLSKFYYNQGLEKASIRDLSGAINCLKQSLTYDKRNIHLTQLLNEIKNGLEIDKENIKEIEKLSKEINKRVKVSLNKLNDKLKITKEETISSFENKLTRNNQVSKPNILYGTELIITQRGPVAPCFTS